MLDSTRKHESRWCGGRELEGRGYPSGRRASAKTVQSHRDATRNECEQLVVAWVDTPSTEYPSVGVHDAPLPWRNLFIGSNEVFSKGPAAVAVADDRLASDTFELCAA
ncbi:MAG: hypothetical protein ACJAR2_002493 [Ilumatobacter sp.]